MDLLQIGLLPFLLICAFVRMAAACIGIGGCALLGYPSYRCAPAYYAANYYPAAGGGCYGGFCRNRLKGSPLLALNGSAEEASNRAQGGGGFSREGQPSEDGEVSSGQRQVNSVVGQERDGFGKSQVSPDALFFECCQSWSLPPQCLLKCSFSNYSAETLRSMFLRTDGCPIESASIIHFCASQNQDHRPCCLQAGIDKTKAGQKCLIFCDQMPENETRLDLGYLPCFERFSEMKRCFYENALRTIDYLEAELEELRKEEAAVQEVGDERDGFTIGRPPIIFVNDLRPKHPQINDDYLTDQQGGEEEDKEENDEEEARGRQR